MNTQGERKKRSIKTKVGDVFTNNSGQIADVIAVHSATSIVVKFRDCGTILEFRQRALQLGNFKNRNTPSVYGVGYMGIGEYNTSLHHHIYRVWQPMLQRCYSEKFKRNRPTYKDCFVEDEWHSFQNFAKWWESQENLKAGVYYEIDKDLLKKGNKIYGPSYCTLVPVEVNLVIGTNTSKRGNLPIGVIWHKRDNCYRAQMTVTEDGIRKNIHLKSSSDPMVCFEAYKKAKEERFKYIAEKFKDLLTPEAYNALMNRAVDIGD